MNHARHVILTYSAQPMRPPPTIAAAMVVMCCWDVDSAVCLENGLTVALILPFAATNASPRTGAEAATDTVRRSSRIACSDTPTHTCTTRAQKIQKTSAKGGPHAGRPTHTIPVRAPGSPAGENAKTQRSAYYFFLYCTRRMVRSVGLLSVFWTLCGSQVRLLVE